MSTVILNGETSPIPPMESHISTKMTNPHIFDTSEEGTRPHAAFTNPERISYGAEEKCGIGRMRPHKPPPHCRACEHVAESKPQVPPSSATSTHVHAGASASDRHATSVL